MRWYKYLVQMFEMSKFELQMANYEQCCLQGEPTCSRLPPSSLTQPSLSSKSLFCSAFSCVWQPPRSPVCYPPEKNICKSVTRIVDYEHLCINRNHRKSVLAISEWTLQQVILKKFRSQKYGRHIQMLSTSLKSVTYENICIVFYIAFLLLTLVSVSLYLSYLPNT